MQTEAQMQLFERAGESPLILVCGRNWAWPSRASAVQEPAGTGMDRATRQEEEGQAWPTGVTARCDCQERAPKVARVPICSAVGKRPRRLMSNGHCSADTLDV